MADPKRTTSAPAARKAPGAATIRASGAARVPIVKPKLRPASKGWVH